MIHWKQLPPPLQQSLQRWYTISVISTCITLSTCTAVTFYAQWNTTKYVSPIDSSNITAQSPDVHTTIMSTVYEDILYALRITPPSIQLLSCTIDSKHYSCEGYTQTPHHITQYIAQLSARAFTRICTISTRYEPEKDRYRFCFGVEKP